MLTAQAELAPAAADPRIDDDVIADLGLRLRNSIAELVDDSGRVGAKRPGRPDGDARQATEHPDVEVVERRGAHPHANLARTRLGHRQVGPVLERIESAVGGDRECSHFDSGYILK